MSYAIDRMIRNARVSLPGSLDDAIKLELWNVLDLFFYNTRLWTEEAQLTVNADDAPGTVYYIEPESFASIIALNNVTNADGMYQRVAMQVPGEVTFATQPDPGTYTATISLNIVDPTNSDGYPEFPEWVLQRYHVGLLHGVMGRMMIQPSKPYTNEKLGAAHLAAFKSAVSVATTEATHQYIANGQSWSFPQTFATRSRRR